MGSARETAVLTLAACEKQGAWSDGHLKHAIRERGLDRLDLEDFGKKLAGRFYGVQLRDHTRLAQDLWARLEEDSLTGLFLQEMDRRRRQDPDSGLVELAVRFGLAALERGEDAAP